MKTVTICNNLDELRKSAAPLYHRYPQQHQPQGAYIELECETGRVAADWNGEIGNAIPFLVYHGHDRRYAIPCQVKGSAVADLLENAEFQTLLQRVVDGYESKWDGNNFVAHLSGEACAAEEEVEKMIAREIREDCDVAEVWAVGDWLFSNCTLRDHWSDQAIAEALAECEAAIDCNQALDGDIEEALIEMAKSDFNCCPEKLTRTHVDELLKRGEVSREEAAEWRINYGGGASDAAREIVEAKSTAGEEAYLWLHSSGDCILWSSEDDSENDDGRKALGRWQVAPDEIAELICLEKVDEHA